MNSCLVGNPRLKRIRIFIMFLLFLVYFQFLVNMHFYFSVYVSFCFCFFRSLKLFHGKGISSSPTPTQSLKIIIDQQGESSVLNLHIFFIVVEAMQDFKIRGVYFWEMSP